VPPRFLLDTNVLSEPLRLRPNAGVMRKLAEHDGFLCTATPVWHELRFGAARLAPGEKQRALIDYLEEVVAPFLAILPYDERAAAWHADERARLMAIGRPPPFVDGMLVAIAATRELALVTHNVADVAHFSGVVVEDWHES
jgi:tRNA(fMet)-specific endonuclease VapC